MRRTSPGSASVASTARRCRTSTDRRVGGGERGVEIAAGLAQGAVGGEQALAVEEDVAEQRQHVVGTGDGEAQRLGLRAVGRRPAGGPRGPRRAARRPGAGSSAAATDRAGSARRSPSRTGRGRGRSGARRRRRAPPRRPGRGPRGCGGRRRRGCARCGSRGRAWRRSTAWRRRGRIGRARSAGPSPTREVGDRHLDLVLALPLVDPLGGGLAGGIGVERQDQLGTEALEPPDVLVGEGGAAGGDRDRQAALGEADHVGVALADDDLVAGARSRPWPSSGRRAPCSSGRARVSGVFGTWGRRRSGIMRPPKPDRIALDVEDREQHPGPEEVLLAPGLVHEPEAGVDERLLRRAEPTGPGGPSRRAPSRSGTARTTSPSKPRSRR